jgi:hypothetical protein
MRNGRRVKSGSSAGSRPMALEMRVVSRLSPGVRGGRMVGSRWASIDLPVPGEPIIMMWIPPAAEIGFSTINPIPEN